VRSRNLKNEEAKERYRAVENGTKRVVTPRKQTTTNMMVHVVEYCTVNCQLSNVMV